MMCVMALLLSFVSAFASCSAGDIELQPWNSTWTKSYPDDPSTLLCGAGQDFWRCARDAVQTGVGKKCMDSCWQEFEQSGIKFTDAFEYVLSVSQLSCSGSVKHEALRDFCVRFVDYLAKKGARTIWSVGSDVKNIIVSEVDQMITILRDVAIQEALTGKKIIKDRGGLEKMYIFFIRCLPNSANKKNVDAGVVSLEGSFYKNLEQCESPISTLWTIASVHLIGGCKPGEEYLKYLYDNCVDSEWWKMLYYTDVFQDRQGGCRGFLKEGIWEKIQQKELSCMDDILVCLKHYILAESMNYDNRNTAIYLICSYIGGLKGSKVALDFLKEGVCLFGEHPMFESARIHLNYYAAEEDKDLRIGSLVQKLESLLTGGQGIGQSMLVGSRVTKVETKRCYKELWNVQYEDVCWVPGVRSTFKV